MEIIIQETALLRNPFGEGVIPTTETVITYDDSTTITEFPHCIRIGDHYPKFYFGQLTVLTNMGHVLNQYETSNMHSAAITKLPLESDKVYQFYRELETQALILAVCTPIREDRDYREIINYSVEEYYVRGDLNALQFGFDRYEDDQLTFSDKVPYFNSSMASAYVFIGDGAYKSIGELSLDKPPGGINWFSSKVVLEKLTFIYGIFYLKDSVNAKPSKRSNRTKFSESD